jgi:hypothetical protein
MKLLNFTKNKKAILKQKIKEINDNFDFQAFTELVKDFKILKANVIFSEIEQWLFELLRKEDFHVINGILAVLYFEMANFEDAQQYAELSQEFFPLNSNHRDLDQEWEEFLVWIHS